MDTPRCPEIMFVGTRFFTKDTQALLLADAKDRMLFVSRELSSEQVETIRAAVQQYLADNSLDDFPIRLRITLNGDIVHEAQTNYRVSDMHLNIRIVITAKS